jgi:hypothetical protein
MPIDPSEVALDLLIYLAHKYSLTGSNELTAFVEGARERSGDFAAWLMELDHAPLDLNSREQLITDINVTLTSMSGKTGFACT